MLNYTKLEDGTLIVEIYSLGMLKPINGKILTNNFFTDVNGNFIEDIGTQYFFRKKDLLEDYANFRQPDEYYILTKTKILNTWDLEYQEYLELIKEEETKEIWKNI
jgi:hypothetical protein